MIISLFMKVNYKEIKYFAEELTKPHRQHQNYAAAILRMAPETACQQYLGTTSQRLSSFLTGPLKGNMTLRSSLLIWTKKE